MLAAQIQLARGGVEGGEQLIGGVGPGFDQGIEQGGLTRIRVAHEGDAKSLAARALAALRVALFFHFFQALAGARNRLANHAPVQLNLGFTRAPTHANATALALQVRPTPHQAGAEVLQARELDLQLTLMAARALREDFQNQQGAVIDRQPNVPLQIALLAGAQGLVKQHFLGLVEGSQVTDFIGFAAADKQRRIGGAPFAGDAGDGLHARGLGE